MSFQLPPAQIMKYRDRLQNNANSHFVCLLQRMSRRGHWLRR
jgi:hypothetical protein